MSVRKRRSQNIPMEKRDLLVRHQIPYELWMMREFARSRAPWRAESLRA